jgi:hypothetical protein
MTEGEIMKYIAANWPSIATGLLVASVWIRLSRFTEKHKTLEKRVRRLMDACAEVNPEHAKKLFDDEGA